MDWVKDFTDWVFGQHSAAREKNRAETVAIGQALVHKDWHIRVLYDTADELTHTFLTSTIKQIATVCDLEDAASKSKQKQLFLRFARPELIKIDDKEDAANPHSLSAKFFQKEDDIEILTNILDKRHKDATNDLTSDLAAVGEICPIVAYGPLLAKALYHPQMIEHDIAFATIDTTIYIALRGSKVAADFKLDAAILQTGFSENKDVKQRSDTHWEKCKTYIASARSRPTAITIVGHSLGGLFAFLLAQNLTNNYPKSTTMSKTVEVYNPFFGLSAHTREINTAADFVDRAIIAEQKLQTP